MQMDGLIEGDERTARQTERQGHVENNSNTKPF